MKTIGIIGGTSWESTVHYYEALNQGVKDKLGGLHSAKILLWSIDFAELEVYQREGRWDKAGEMYANLARSLEQAGAECIVIAANTMHKVANSVKEAVSIPLIHIGDATADAVKACKSKRVLLLGTRYTMEQPFLRDHLSNLGVEVVVPEPGDIERINRIIYEELCLGRVLDASRHVILEILEKNREHAIEGVILGCTELAMILHPEHVDLQLFDTTELHVRAILQFSFES